MISAPVAPMAPPSVGVAMPMKMVPSTRKISASGGISTKVTFSAIFDNRPSLNTRLSDGQREGDGHADAHGDDDQFVGRLVGRLLHGPEHGGSRRKSTVSTSSEVPPVLPLGSRKTRASGGSAGAAFGKKMVMPIT